MRALLVHADRTAAMEPRMESALAIARAVKGHLTVIVDTPVARYVSADPMSGNVLAAEALNQALADDDDRAARIEAELRRESAAFTVVRSEGEPADTLSAAARLADLLILSRGDGLADALAASLRVPLLLLPDAAPLTLPASTAFVAWDGSEQAAAALRASVPLLAQCRSVRVVSVQEGGSAVNPEDPRHYLAQHGIAADGVLLERDGSVAETISKAVAAGGAELLVMGAFGRGRMREYLFGGVTRHFLDTPQQAALLLAH